MKALLAHAAARFSFKVDTEMNISEIIESTAPPRRPVATRMGQPLSKPNIIGRVTIKRHVSPAWFEDSAELSVEMSNENEQFWADLPGKGLYASWLPCHCWICIV